MIPSKALPAKRVPPLCKRGANAQFLRARAPTKRANAAEKPGHNRTEPSDRADPRAVTKGRNPRLAVSHSRTFVDLASCLEMSPLLVALARRLERNRLRWA